MMKAILPAFALLAAVASAQEDRCDAPYPQIFCNTTEILAFESSDCKPYHIFLARGSDEPYPGRQGNITGQICSRLGGSDKCNFENIEYPAKSTGWGKDAWCKSAAKGAEAGQAQMRNFSQKCPNTKLILLGFSQGASVAQDILGGGGGKVFECEQPSNPPMDATKAPGSNIVAAVTFGAVSRSRNQNFTIGDGVNFDGRRARTQSQLSALNKYSNVLRDYCHYGDPMCAVGSKPENTWVHLDYFLAHNEEVTAWIAEAAKKDVRPVSTLPDGSSRPSTQSLESSTVIAKSASIPTATLSIIAAKSNAPTNSLEVQSAQTGNVKSESTNSGAVYSLSGYVVLGAAALSIAFGF